MMIFALGTFIVPNQLFLAQSADISCCTSTNDSSDCCNTKSPQEQPCHDSDKENSCGDHCTSCANCHLIHTFFYKKPVEVDPVSVAKITENKEQFNYITPDFTGIFLKIWQPPKIG